MEGELSLDLVSDIPETSPDLLADLEPKAKPASSKTTSFKLTNVFKSNESNREIKEPVKKSELLSSLTSTAPVGWGEFLMQKLVDGKVDLADAKVREYANKQVEATKKKIDNLFARLQHDVSSFGRFEDKVTFEIDPKSTIQIPSQKIYLRSLTFDISLKSAPFDLIMTGSGVPKGKFCKARVEVTIKNQAGQRVSMRNFSKAFKSTRKGCKLVETLRGIEYEDESLGFKKNGKLIVEVAVHTDELAEYEAQANPPAYKGRPFLG